MATTVVKPFALSVQEGRRLQSGPGRDLIFKATGDDTAGAFDYFIVEVAPHGGPPLHVHHDQHETIHVLKGRFKIAVGDELFRCDEGGFALMPAGLPHAFLNLTAEPADVLVVYVPGGGHRFYEEFGPAARAGADRSQLAAIFERHGMTLLGAPLASD